MMNTRTSRAPASTANGGTNHQEIGRQRYIKYQSVAYGTSVSMICHKARQVEDFWYLATISFHAALSARGFAGTEFKSFIVKSFFLTRPSLPVGRHRLSGPPGSNPTQIPAATIPGLEQ